MSVPTIKVKYPYPDGDDYAIINVADFNPHVHQPFDADEAAKVGVSVSSTATADGGDAEADAPRARRGRTATGPKPE